MMLRSCSREKEVKELVELGQWPAACAPELRMHVDGCKSCGELVLVKMVFQQARAEALGAASIGAPGVLWWRAQLRRRNEAVERIGRPILGAQIFALVLNLLLALGFAGWEARHGFAWLTWIEELPQTAALHLDTLWTYAQTGSQWNWIVLLPAIATVALLGGVVVYLASEKQ